MEEQGFEPWAFRMQSGRSATELHPLYVMDTGRGTEPSSGLMKPKPRGFQRRATPVEWPSGAGPGSPCGPPGPPGSSVEPPVTFCARSRPERSSWPLTNETLAPSTRQLPSSMAETWQKRSSPPSSGSMKPKPFSSL